MCSVLIIQNRDMVKNTTTIQNFINDIDNTILERLYNSGVTNTVCDNLAAIETAKRLNMTLQADDIIETWVNW